MAEIYTVRSILGDESLQNLINQGKSQDEIISIAKAYKDEAIKSGDKDALSKMNLVNQKQGKADFFTRLGDKMDANGYETMGSIARGIDILASKAAAPIANLVGDSDKEAQILADMKLTQSINEAKKLDEIATTPRTQREYMIDSNNLLGNAIGSYTKDSKTYARNLVEQAENSGYSAMDRFNIGMATTANSIKYLIKSTLYGEDSKEANDIKDAQKILQASRDAYEANNPDKWNIANFAGEMVTDPLNAVGLAKGFKVANSAFKKGANVAFDLAQLGAIGGMAGAISEYGSYKEGDEQNVAGAAAVGAGAGVALGAGFMALGAVLNKIASRFGQKSTLEQNAQTAKDETTKELEKGTPQDIDKRLQKISDDIEEAFSADENAENIARLLGQEYDDNINKAIKESEEVSTAIDDSVAKFANDNPKASASDIEIYINKTYAPSQSEKELTRIINDDKPVTPRMAGYRVLGVLQKSMEYKTRFEREVVVKRFKNHGFNDELANVFADAYTADDISVARNYLDSKVASNRQKSVEDGRNEWLENTTKSNEAKTPKNQDEILEEISSDKTQFKLIDDSDMTAELKSRLENDGYTLEREPESGVWEISKAISDQEIKRAENTQGNSKILTNQDIKEQISKWDLNAPKQTLITNKIDGEELEKLNEHFKFKGNYPLTRQIDSEHIKHALNHHGDEKTEALRGQKAITLDDISNYENYAKTADIKEYSDKKVISKKQINGHFVVVEEALTGKNRLNFVSMWYVKGKIKDVAPVSTPKNDLDRTLSNRYDSSNSTPNEIKSQEPQATKQAETTAKETTQVEPNTNSRLEKIKKFIQGKTNKALDSEIKTYNELYRYVLDDFAKAHPDELNLPKYASEMANYITKEFLVKHDKEIKEIIAQKTSGENRQIVLNAFENLKQNFDELRSVGIGDLIKPTAKGIKDKIAEIEIKSMSDKELVTQFQKLKDSKARVNENLYKYLENEIKKREKKLYPFINSDKDYSYDLEKQLKNRGLMGLKDSDLENIAKERNSVLYLPSYIRENIEQELNIKPIKEFGTNYAEFYHDGANAIKKLLTEREGQVAGAFEREELGDIDLVWGEVTDHIKHKGYGLSHILDKRIYQYIQQGLSKEEAEARAIELINKLPDIIKNGEIIKKPNEAIQIITDDTKIVLKSNYYGEPTNKWIVTTYERLEKDLDISAKPITKSTNSPLNSSENSTTTANKSQELNLSRAERRAMGIEEPKGKTSKNNIDGREVKFTKRSLDKMTSGSAVGKSLDNGFTREEHYEAAQNILEIFKTAKFLETQPPKNGSPDILGVHKYIGEYKNANVKITIKEIREHGNTFYSIELMELLSRDIQSGDPKTGNLDNTAIIHTDEEPPRPRTSSPYNANSKTIPNQDLKNTDEALQNAVAKADKLDILDKSKPFRKAEKSELTDELMEEVIKNDSKLWIDNASDEVSKLVGLPNAKITLNGSAIKHALERHGENSINVKNGEPPITIDDIKNHADIVNNADKRTFGVSDDGQKVLISAKQINGHFVVVETIGTKKRQLSFKTMYKVNGKLENNPLFKDSTASAKQIETAESSLSPKPSANLDSLSRANTKNSTTTANKSQEANLSRAERRAMGIEEPKGKTLVIDEKAVKSDVREFGRLAHQVGLGFKSAKEAKAVMDKCDKSKFDCGS